jgi:hypothetical protein
MKKIIVFLMLSVLAVMAMAQDHSVTLKGDAYYYEFNLGNSDTIIASDTWWAQVIANKAEPVRMQVLVDMDSISGAGHDSIFLQGRVFSTDSWSAIDTGLYAHTGTGLVSVYNTDSDMYYRCFRVYVKSTSTTGKNKIVAIKVKIWKLH